MRTQIGLKNFTLQDVYTCYSAAARASKYPGASLWSAEDFHESLNKNTLFLASENAKIAAFILMQELDSELEILLLAADPQFWGRGSIDLIWQQQILTKPSETRIFLDVHESNLPAIKVYERLGFTKTHRRNGYYSDGGAAILYQFQILP